MVKKVIFISSLPHCGSTLTDFIIGTNSKAISFGEVQGVIRNFVLKEEIKNSCSCKDKECKVWSELKKRVWNINISFSECYIEFLNVVASLYGEDIVVVDSSKNLRNMKKLKEILGDKLQFIFLIKDMRNYAISQLDRNAKMKEFNRRSFFIWNVLSWYRWNNKILNFYRENNYEYFKVGYEELTINYQKIIPKICEYIGLEFEEEMFIPQNNKTSHIVYGNAWIQVPEKLKAINYDYRWFTRSEVFINGLFMLPFKKFNDEFVYSNLKLETVAFKNKRVK